MPTDSSPRGRSGDPLCRSRTDGDRNPGDHITSRGLLMRRSRTLSAQYRTRAPGGRPMVFPVVVGSSTDRLPRARRAAADHGLDRRARQTAVASCTAAVRCAVALRLGLIVFVAVPLIALVFQRNPQPLVPTREAAVRPGAWRWRSSDRGRSAGRAAGHAGYARA